MQGLYSMYGVLSTEPMFGNKAYSVTEWLETETIVLAEFPQSFSQTTQLIYNDTHASHLLT